jgi:hypothetical protein
MTKNPFINALAAVGYIAAVASFMFFSPKFEDAMLGVLVPMAVLSLFVLSAAVMGFIFFYQPILLFIDGKRQEAVRLFGKTLAIFALITIVLLASIVVWAPVK